MLSAGEKHSAAVTIEGYLYTWGSNERGQLGLMTKQGGKTVGEKVAIPHIVPELVGFSVRKVVARGTKVLVLSEAPVKEVGENKEIFAQWKAKLLEHERSLISTVDSDYRTHKREQRLQEENKRRELDRKKMGEQVKLKKMLKEK